MRCSLALALFLLSVMTGMVWASFEDDIQPYLSRFVVLEAPSAIDLKRFELGRALFEEPSLSGSGKLSCASCHLLQHYSATNNSIEQGDTGQSVRHNSPGIFNVSNNYLLGWTGDIVSLETQVSAALLSKRVMNSNWHDILLFLKSNDKYRADFSKSYGGRITEITVTDAIVYFEKNLLTPSRFDEFLKGRVDVFNSKEQQGFLLFNQLGCSSCHNGVNLGGNMLQRFGIFSHLESPATTDTRYRVAPLRNVEMTAPYFHHGKRDTLNGAIRMMSQYQLGRNLPDEQVEMIEMFLKTLTAEPGSWWPK